MGKSGADSYGPALCLLRDRSFASANASIWIGSEDRVNMSVVDSLSTYELCVLTLTLPFPFEGEG